MCKLRSIFEADFLNNYLFLNSEEYLKFTSFQKKSRSIDKLLLK